MEVTDFDYDLPQELIAQTPVEPRDSSRLLVMDKKTGELEHRHFFNLPEYLKPGDLLVFNDTRVIPARLHGFKTTGAHVEVFLLTRKNATDWEVLVKPGKKLQKGARIKFSDELSCEILDTTDFGGRIARFQYDGIFEEILDRLGETPLPPTSMKNWRTRNGTRPCTTGNGAARRPLRPASTLPGNCSRKSGTWGWKKCSSLSMWGWAPSVR